MSVTWKTTDPQHQHQLRQLELDGVRLPDHARAAVGVPAVAGRPRAAVPAAEPHEVRPRGACQRAEPGVGAAARRRAERVSAIGFGLGAATAAAAGSVYGLLYPFNPGSHYDLISRLLSIVAARRARQHRRRGRRRRDRLGVVGGRRRRRSRPAWSEMTFFVILLAGPAGPTAGPVRHRRPGCDMSDARGRSGARGRLLRRARPRCRRSASPHWVLNMLVFTLMYAVMSSAWNLIGGFAGYPSLGHAAFFGIGAYPIAIWFQHHSITSGYEPFLLLPFVGLSRWLHRAAHRRDRDAHPRRRVRDRHDHAAVRRADAGVQPAQPHRRRAGRVDAGRAVLGGDLRVARSTTCCSCCWPSRWV